MGFSSLHDECKTVLKRIYKYFVVQYYFHFFSFLAFCEDLTSRKEGHKNTLNASDDDF